MMYAHIVFDVDGTLLDSEKAILYSLSDLIYRIQGKRRDVSELRFALGQPGELILNQLEIDYNQFTGEIWNDCFKKHLGLIQIFEGIRPMLKELQESGVELGIVTSKTRREYQNDFYPLGIGDYFTTVICMEDSDSPKPSAAPMLKYLEITGVKKTDVLYLGDTIYDSQCALKAGVDFGLALWGCHSSAALDIKATYYLKSPHDVLACCQQESL